LVANPILAFACHEQRAFGHPDERAQDAGGLDPAPGTSSMPLSVYV
jgi:hypothetical protein